MTEIIFDIETTGLNPLEDRITVIVIKNTHNQEIISFSCKDEKDLLEAFWSKIDEEDNLIGYCSDTFDYPFILKRSLIKNVKIKKIKTVDVKKIVDSFYTSYNKYEKGKLSDWAEILGIEVKTENGSEMIKLWREKEINKVIEHCKEDVKITELLYLRCKECGLF